MHRTPLMKPSNINVLTRHRLLSILLVLGILLVGLVLPSPVDAQDGSIIHVVQQGEYLSTIARKYGVSLGILMSHNNISNPNLIRVGQLIRIPSIAGPLPSQAAPTSTPAPFVTSTAPIVSATKTPMTEPSSSASSSASSSSSPTSPPTASTPIIGGSVAGFTAQGEPVYIVRRGDNLTGIASQFGVTVRDIVLRNRLPSLNIYIAQRLIIPIYGVTSAPTQNSSSQNSSSQPLIATATPRATSVFGWSATPTRSVVPTESSNSLYILPTVGPTSTPTPSSRLR